MFLERPFLLIVFPFSMITAVFVFAGLMMTPDHTPKFYPEDQMEVARIVSIEGRVDISRYHTHEYSRLRKGKSLDIPIYHMDKITAQARSKTKLSFLDGYELTFSPYSQFVLEAWDLENKSGPIYVNMLAGDYKMVRKGQLGTVYIVRNNQIFAPSNKPKNQPRRLFSSHQQSFKRVARAASVNTKLKSKEPKIKQGQKMPSVLDTLTNEQIDKTIARNVDQLRKCQSSSLRESRKSTGKLTLNLEIAPRGRLTEVSVVASSLSNEELEDCITSVFKRIKFRSFTGPKIVRSYPIVFD